MKRKHLKEANAESKESLLQESNFGVERFCSGSRRITAHRVRHFWKMCRLSEIDTSAPAFIRGG